MRHTRNQRRRLTLIVLIGCLALAGIAAIEVHRHRAAAGSHPASSASQGTGAAVSATSRVAPPVAPADPTRHNCAPSPHTCDYPDASNTGVPAGMALIAVPGQRKSGAGWKWTGGWISVTGNGAVISGYSISGHIEISASNVVVKDNNIMENSGGSNWGVALRGGSNNVIENNTIYSTAETGNGRLQTGIKDFGGSAGVQVLNNNIFHTESGVQIEQGLIQGNYIHDLGYNSGDHVNGITSNGGVTGMLSIVHNTVLDQYNQTDAVGLFEDSGVQANRLVTNNLLAGGDFTIYGGQNAGGQPISNITITDNRISTIFFPNGGQFGPFDAMGSAGASNNFWDTTGEVIKQ